MELHFYGGASEVGRSAILLKDDRSILFDCGIKIDHKIEYPISVPKADAMVLSHAHLDHSGFAPGLYNESFVPTFGTIPTLRLSNLLLDDSLSIARKEHLKARFHKRQVVEFVNRFTALDYHNVAHFGNFDLSFYDAGHISGSSVTLLERTRATTRKRIVYTGDLKIMPQTLHKGAELVKSDVLIIESTYATREHEDRQKVVRQFISEIEDVIDNGGTALVPAFAVGRSQELLTILQAHDLAGMTYIDGMAKDATSIVANYPKYISNPDLLAKAVREVNWIRDRRERKEALDGPSIILTTSGMLNGGPAMEYITKLNKNSRVLLTGFQQEGTNGRMLLDTGSIMMHDGRKKINAPVSFHDFSAHAGMKELYDYVRKSSPEVVVCVHGSEDNTKSFATHLREEGFEAYAPKVGGKIDLGE